MKTNDKRALIRIETCFIMNKEKVFEICPIIKKSFRQGFNEKLIGNVFSEKLERKSVYNFFLYIVALKCTNKIVPWKTIFCLVNT